jgi:CO/xanthine dehydrogenase FAD-binding subunit
MTGYLRPRDLNEALTALRDAPLAVVAGGTDYYPALVERLPSGSVLDISALFELRRIEVTPEHFRIGAGVTWTDLIRAELPTCFDGLKLAAREIGGIQIQNTATIVGNVCNASPAADSMPNLVALDAEVELSAVGGRRQVRVADFVTGNRKTLRRPEELVTALLVPRGQAGGRSSFLKLGARRYLVISIVMVAVVLEAERGRVKVARIAVGACSATPKRLTELEQGLAGRPLRGLGTAVVPAHLDLLSPIDDVRASAGYRQDAALILVRRALDVVAAAA